MEYAQPRNVDVDDRLMELLGQIYGTVSEFDANGRYLRVWTPDPLETLVPRDTMIGRTFVEVWGEANAHVLSIIRQVYESGVTEHTEVCAHVRGKDRWFSVDLKRIRRVDRFTVVGVRVEITERKATEEALRVSEERFRLAADATDDLLYDLDIQSDTCMWGPSMTRLFGHPTTINVQTWVDGVHPDDRAALHAAFMHAVADPAASRWQFGYRVRRPDGSYADVLDRGGFLRDTSGKALRFIGSLADVTRLNRLQAQLVQSERLAALGMLAAGVGHEINNPLAFVLGNLELAIETATFAKTEAEKAEEDEMRLAMREAHEGALRIREIVKGLRLIARNEPTERMPVELQDVVERALKISESELRHRARIVRAFGQAPRVRVNESQLGQVCLNLLINAAQAIPPGESERNEVVVSTGVDQNDRPFIAVRDSGGGIAPEMLGRIFDPFFTTKPVGVGTGIGLSVCMNLVQGMGGQITVISRPGATVFTVTLPTRSPSVRPVAA